MLRILNIVKDNRNCSKSAVAYKSRLNNIRTNDILSKLESKGLIEIIPITESTSYRNRWRRKRRIIENKPTRNILRHKCRVTNKGEEIFSEIDLMKALM